MDIECDLLVIGGGMAGLVAGTVAAEAGLSTILLRKGQSATAYSSGAIDVLGYLPDASEPFSTPEEGLTAIAGLCPLHPYSIIGYGEGIEPSNVVAEIVGRTRSTLAWLKEKLKDTIAPLSGDFKSNIFPITILGTTKPTCLVQKTMYSESLQKNEDSVLLFTGFSGNPDFNPSASAKTYLEDRIAIGEPPRKVGHCTLQVSPFGKSYNVSSVEIARHLDHENSIEDFAKQLKPQVEQLGATHVAVPPVLGIRNAIRNKKNLEDLIGAEVFELLGFPPSVPGMRLQLALDGIFRKSGGKLLVGHEAISYIKNEGRLKSIIAKTPRRETKIDAKVFILSTGKYIGGGLAGDENGIRETVFGLMTVTDAYHSAREIIPSRYTNRIAITPEGQPVNSCGLTLDPHFRPVTEEGVEWVPNLFSAGAVLAGYDYSIEKSGLGVAAMSGFSAAKNAIDFIKEVS
ncbi:MAG: anaerobic glycerol-3-phosphate dehydrogenase subunit GlpB [Candidatus Thorarchaeota archaeon]|jgi:glycerol-3-phosphate dehydrogenase subunit B